LDQLGLNESIQIKNSLYYTVTKHELYSSLKYTPPNYLCETLEYSLRQSDSQKSHILAYAFVRLASCSGKNDYGGDWIIALTDTGKTIRIARTSQMVATFLGTGFGRLFEASLRFAPRPYQSRLTTPELVELLKMPTCLSEDRRAVLDQLGNLHRRHFNNHWEFVRFAREKGLDIDFTMPPRRPDPKQSLEHLLDELPVNP
jgi:hypothetical protein